MEPENIWRSECGKAHGPDWLKWLAHLRGEPAIGLELGTWKGESAEWMCENIFTALGARYFCVDTFEGSVEHHVGNIDCATLEAEATERLARFRPVAKIIKGRSDLVLRQWQGQPFDFVYVDASHDSPNVLRDSVLAWDLLKIGGVLVWDDYEWTVMLDPLDCPRTAIDAFLTVHSRGLEVLGKGWQVAVRKLA